MSRVEDTPAAAGGEQPTGPESPPSGDGWRKDRQGRWYVAARGRSGVVYRQGEETIEEALARDAKGPRDRKPGASKSKAAPKKPPAPTKTDLKQLEFALAEGLKAPAVAGAMIGDEWLAEHFMTRGPVLARNLVVAAEHNPWLREKLEAMVAGEDFFIKLVTTASLGGAVFAYAAPPVIYLVNPPFVSEQARAMLGVPERKPKEERDGPAPAAPAAPPTRAAPAAAA